MEYFYAIISLLAGTGVFLFGFKVMSDSTEKLANNKLRNMFNKTSNKKIVSMGIGAVTTAIIQSSAATTVMVIGFVNAGIITLYQAAAIIMGANIGTTITAQIVALQAFNIVQIATVLAFVGIVLNMFFKSDKTKTLGLMLLGLGLVFVGLDVMKDSMTIFAENPNITGLLSSVNNPFLLIILGAVITAVVQSSSAVTSILISMAGAGILIGSGGNAVFFFIMGTNIGTCVTAIISSLGANANARRASVIHFLFNLFGSLLFMIVLLIWKDFKAVTFDVWFSHPSTQIAMFHTFFNVICVALFLPFTKYFVKLSEIIIKDKKNTSVTTVLLDDRFLKAPAVALTQVSAEACLLADMSFASFKRAVEGFLQKETSYKIEIDEKNEKIAILNKQVVAYLVKVSMLDVSFEDKQKISALHYVLNDIMRVSEIADNLTKYTKSTVEQSLVFSDEVIYSLEKMFDKISELYNLSMEVFKNNDKTLLLKIDALEDEIDVMRKTLVEEHIERLNEGKCSPQNSGVFIQLVGNLERAADHITFIAHSVESVESEKELANSKDNK